MHKQRVIELPFCPREWQRPLIDNPSPRIICVVHRRAGKSTALMWRGIKRCLTINRKEPLTRVVYLLPFAVQWARTGLWDQLAQAALSIPGAKALKSERMVRFPNGAVFQCGGADNPDVWRGGGADEAICDEFDDMNPSIIPLVIEPMLSDREGTLLISGTPKGRGLLRDKWMTAGTSDEWSRLMLTYKDTGVLPEPAIDRLRREMTEDEFAQELECSFDAPHAGSIFGAKMARAQIEGRITRFAWEPSMPVHTAWDLGRRHAMVIWCFQTIGREVRVIDVLWGVGGDLPAFAKDLDKRPYKYGKHLLPHDVRVGELGTGKTRVETLLGLGIRATIIPNIAKMDGINSALTIIPRCWFNTHPIPVDFENQDDACKRMERAIKALFEYRREWVDTLGTYRMDSVDDWTADYADAFRMMAVGTGDRMNEAGPRAPFVAKSGRLT